MRSVLPVVGSVLAIQMLEGTNPLTALEYGAFLLVTADAFNAVGGLIFPSGAYIFFFSLLSVGVGGVAKMVLGEPLDSNVVDAQKTMLVYLVGACSIWAAARVAVRLRRKRPFLAGLELNDRINQTGLGSALMGQYGWILFPASVVSTFNQLNNFLPLGILILVYSRTKETNGYKSFSVLGFAIWAYSTVVWGILAFTKQGMFQPSAVWAIGALLAGYQTSLKKLALVGALALTGATLLTPVSQVGRNYRYQADSNEVAWSLLLHPLDTRQRYLENETGNLRSSRPAPHWFNEPQGLLDRMTMFPIDDALIHLTDQGHTRGIFPIESYVINMIPRYLMPGEKPQLHWGNQYAHEIGMLGKNDRITGISFTAMADGYHCVKWYGVTLVSFPIFIMLFTFCDSLTGSTDQTFWAALYIMLFTHAAAEGMLGAPFASVSTYAVGIVVAAVLSRYFLPYIGGFFIPPKRAQVGDVSGLQSPWVKAPHVGRPSLARTIEGNL